MKKILKFLVAATLILVALFAIGCEPDNPLPDNPQPGDDPPPPQGSLTYIIYVRSDGGIAISGANVKVLFDGSVIEEKTTDKDGKIEFTQKADVYEINVENLPKGYTLSSDEPLKTNATQYIYTVYAKSSVINEPVPEGKVYAKGDVMYEFSLPDENGVNHSLSETLKTKKMVLLNFWSIKCGPCMNEMPELELTYRKYKNDAEVFALGVPFSGEPCVMEDINGANGLRSLEFDDKEIGKYNITFPAMIATEDMIGQFLQRNAIPVTIVVDRYGVLAYWKVGSLTKSDFESIFALYTSDDYVQNTVEKDKPDPQLPERTKPNVTAPASAEIEEAINNQVDFTYTFGADGLDSEYNWPWLIGETNGYKYIYPANGMDNKQNKAGIGNSYSAISTTFNITADQLSKGELAILFDFKVSSEESCDVFDVIVNGTLMKEYSGTSLWTYWESCYPYVINEAGEYTMTFLYIKDNLKDIGSDTVRIKNLRLVPASDIKASSLDVPRPAARGYNGGAFSFYAEPVLGADGFYHNGENGPYLLANLLYSTAFNLRTDDKTSVSDIVSSEDGASLAFHDEMEKWINIAKDSELYGYVPVNESLKELIGKYTKHVAPSAADNAWIELCTYFDHYGTDAYDKGISEPRRNPIRGLIKEAAISVTMGDKNGLNITRPLVSTDKIVFKLEIEEAGSYKFIGEKKPTLTIKSASGELIKEFTGESDASEFVIVLENGEYYIEVAITEGETGEVAFTVTQE